MTYLGTKFEVAPSHGLCSRYIYKKRDGHTYAQTDGQTDGQWTNFGLKLIYLFSKRKSGYNKGQVFQSNMSKNTVDGNCMTKKCDSDVKHKPSLF